MNIPAQLTTSVGSATLPKIMVRCLVSKINRQKIWNESNSVEVFSSHNSTGCENGSVVWSFSTLSLWGPQGRLQSSQAEGKKGMEDCLQGGLRIRQDCMISVLWIGRGSVSWPHLSAREAGKCSPAICRGRKKEMGFEVQPEVSVLSTKPGQTKFSYILI